MCVRARLFASRYLLIKMNLIRHVIDILPFQFRTLSIFSAAVNCVFVIIHRLTRIKFRLQRKQVVY